MNKKNIFFFSNPFGFGPTAKAVAIMNICLKYWENAKLHYVANADCTQIFDKKDVNVIYADQRNPAAIRNVLSRFQNAYIVSSLNRFAIKIAAEQNIPNCFIDSLTWMWDKIPEDYLLTDLYFALNFPGLDEKIKAYPSIIKVPYIIDSEAFGNKHKKSDLLVNIGGCMNPLTNECPKSFLQLLALGLNAIQNKKILICGGIDAIMYIKKYVNQYIQCVTLKKDVFLSSMTHTKHFLTTSGLNASLEAFNYNVPTSFLMPTNLSQWENLRTFDKFNAANNKITWENIIQSDLNIQGKTEKVAIQRINSVADYILNDDTLKKKTIFLIKTISETRPNIEKQKEFIYSIGSNGADVIAKTLKERWSL